MKNASTPTPLDRHFAELMERLAGQPSSEVRLAAMGASHHRSLGHICLPLSEIAGTEIDGERVPELKRWVKKLRASKVVGEPGDFKPLILDSADRLYMRRYWEYETNLVRMIEARLNGSQPVVDEALLRAGITRLFAVESGEFNRQKLAAFAAVTRNFSVISGGPGTGKTRTVVMILALLLQQEGDLRIALTAPTGKAAARLKDSIENAAKGFPDELRVRLPKEAATIHRLLGAIPASPYFRHNAASPLVADVVIVDEASMVDLALMAKLLDAVPPQARVILLGDKDQLASVEAGAVLGDLCNTGVPLEPAAPLVAAYAKIVGEKPAIKTQKPLAPIHGGIVDLRRNYRFPGGSGIGELSRMINGGDADGALRFLSETKTDAVVARALPAAGLLGRALREPILAGYGDNLEVKEPSEVLSRFQRFRILCAVRRGPFGVENLNALVAAALEEAGVIGLRGPWYRGRPVMITANDYNLKLFNGDIGIVLPDDEGGGELRAFFTATDGTLRRFLPSRLPPHETAFAMTVHKSQGSEFERVLLLLPDAESPVVTRELLYTGITRARSGVELWYREPELRAAVARVVRRDSGLRDALWTG